MTKKSYISKSGDEWVWNESKELREYIKSHGNTNRREQDSSIKSKKSK